MAILSQVGTMTPPPGVGETVANVANTAGTTIISAVVDTLPFVLPITAVIWGIRFALKKIKF